MRVAPAKRLVLSPAETLPPEAAEAAMVTLAEAPPDGPLRIGQLLRVADAKLVVRDLEPPRAGVVGAATEVHLDLASPNGGVEDSWDVAFLLDCSYAMRAHGSLARDAAASFLANADGLISRVALLGYAREPFRVQPFSALANARVASYEGLALKGDGAVVDACDFALAEVTRARGRRRRAVVLVTDGAAAKEGSDAAMLVDAGRRAKRIGVSLFAFEVGERSTPGLEEACVASGGVVTRRRDRGLRPIAEALAAEISVPLHWRDSSVSDGPPEFEVVVRAISPEPPEFPKIPRKRRRP